MSRTEIKALAKSQIQGKIPVLFVIYLLYILIFGLVSYIPEIGSIVGTLFSPAFTLAIAAIYLELTKGIDPKIESLFAYIKDFWKVFCLSFMIGLFTILWSCLFLVPGIIKSLSYSLAFFIKIERPELSVLQAISESKRMMHGHKMDLFVLYLSFIPWVLLGTFTCGIAYIYVGPYFQATFANFYNSIKPVANTYSSDYSASTDTNTSQVQLEF